MLRPIGVSQAAWALGAGLSAGFVLGFLGAGGTVVGLPFFLYLSVMAPHSSLGTNALGVSMIATALFVVRLWRKEALVEHGVVFALPGLAGILVGAEIGLRYPGAGLVFLLGFVLFAIAGWLFFLGRRVRGTSPSSTTGSRPRISTSVVVRVIPVALAVGVASVFFGIGGGFMVVPSLSLAAGVELTQAVSAALLPIAAFAGLVGASYAVAGDASVWLALVMVPAGVLGGLFGIWLGRRVGKAAMYVIFAAFLALLGAYIVARG